MKGKDKNIFVLHGVAASAALALVYFLVVTAVQDFSHALSQFASLWYLMLPLIAGFGVQIGMFSYIRAASSVPAGGVVACGGVSTASMIACCAHHVTDVLPLVGMGALAFFLGRYQAFFLLVGVVSNVIGMLFMLSIMQRSRLYRKKSTFGRLFAYDIKKIRNASIIVFIPLLALIFILIS